MSCGQNNYRIASAVMARMRREVANRGLGDGDRLGIALLQFPLDDAAWIEYEHVSRVEASTCRELFLQ